MAGVASKTKKLFSRGIVPVYKDHGVTRQDIAQWIKLTLYFEDSSIRHGKLFLELIPRFPEWFQTGICVVGFGLHAPQFAALRRYWRHEWIVTALLGKQTADFYSRSPLLAEHEHRHINADTVRCALNKFVGQIEQTNMPHLVNEQAVAQLKNERANRLFNSWSNVEGQTVDEGVQISRLNDDIDDERQDELAKNINNSLNGHSPLGKDPTLRIKQCHSIELLQMDDTAIRIRVLSDGLFSCRTFVRDLGLHLGCHAVIDQLHLRKVGPLTAEQALAKHELHLEQIKESIAEHTAPCEQYLAQLRTQYPDASPKYRFV